MFSMKLGSKANAFQRKGQAWFCTTGLPSDIIVEVCGMSFHLHKDPLELDIVLSFPDHGFHLRFDPLLQRLRLIEIFDVKRLQMRYATSLIGGCRSPSLFLLSTQNTSVTEKVLLSTMMEVKVNKKVQANMAWLLTKLGEANPSLKVDITDFCATVSSDGDEFGTPITSGTTPGTTGT